MDYLTSQYPREQAASMASSELVLLQGEASDAPRCLGTKPQTENSLTGCASNGIPHKGNN